MYIIKLDECVILGAYFSDMVEVRNRGLKALSDKASKKCPFRSITPQGDGNEERDEVRKRKDGREGGRQKDEG